MHLLYLVLYRVRRPCIVHLLTLPTPVPKASKRIWNPRPAGLDPARSAPFWRGLTAERIVARRKRQYERDKQAKHKKH